MRLTAEQIAAIRRTAAELFGADARVWLFGSRVDDRGVGGDIDLLIETGTKAELRRTLRAQALLEQALGEPVDLITSSPHQAPRPIERIARLTGVPLT